MPFLPYRAKNPPERVPYVTYSLIAINFIIFLCTVEWKFGFTIGGDHFLYVRHNVVDAAAISWTTMLSEPWRLFTAMFLHEEPLHLFGNMLFLWIFGPAVEGRIGYVLYAGLYTFTGLFSGFFQALVSTTYSPDRFSLGASGAIMGVMGAYIWVFPFATICVIVPRWLARLHTSSRNSGWIPIVEWQAQWVVLYYFAGDLFWAMVLGEYSGVGNFAHMSGLMSGFAVVALLKVKRDGRRASEARKMRADGVNLDALSLEELADMLRTESHNEKLILAYGTRITDIDRKDWEPLFVDGLRKYGPVLAEKSDPKSIAVAAMAYSSKEEKLPMIPLLRIGARLEKWGGPDHLRLAAQLFKMLFKQEKTGHDAETALMRLAQLTERLVAENLTENRNEPVTLYQMLIRRFPQSAHVVAAHDALRRLGSPSPMNSPSLLDRPATAGRLLASDDLRPL